MKKKQFNFPHTIVFMLALIILFAIMTWVIPAGQFETEVVNGRTLYIPGTYHQVESAGQGVWATLQSIQAGFIKNAPIFFMIFITGGAIYMLEQTHALDAIFGKFAKLPKKATPFVVGLVMLFMSLVGSTGAFSNPIVALMPIGILLSSALGMDKTVGFIMVYYGSYIGFNVGATNVFTVGVAQSIAELPAFSGLGMRYLFHAVNFVITFLFAYQYMKKIQKEPTASLNYEPGMVVTDYMGEGISGIDNSNTTKLTLTHILSFGGFIVAVAAIVIGALKASWAVAQFTAVFVALAVYLGVVNRMKPNEAVKMFIKGCSTMTGAALIIGFAGTLPTLLTNGKIMHTVIYWLSIPISKVGPAFGAVLMFWANLIINLFIPSGSGQAAAVMPIMVPIADMCGITRQVAVQAFQFGDGISNNIVPTAGTLMGCLAVADMNYGKFAKWGLKLLLAQIILASVALFILQTAGWTGGV